MALYIVYDQAGRILDAHRAYASDAELAAHEAVMNHLGQSWLREPGTSPDLPSPEHFYVVDGVRTERPVMPIVANKQQVAPGGDDYVLLTGLQPSATVRLFAGNIKYDEAVTDPDTTEMEFHPPAPGEFSIVIEKWPFKTFNMSVESR